MFNPGGIALQWVSASLLIALIYFSNEQWTEDPPTATTSGGGTVHYVNCYIRRISIYVIKNSSHADLESAENYQTIDLRCSLRSLAFSGPDITYAVNQVGRMTSIKLACDPFSLILVINYAHLLVNR